MFGSVSLTVEEVFSQISLTMVFNVVLTILVAAIVYKMFSRLVSTTARRVKLQREKVEVIRNFVKALIGGLALISILGSMKVDVTGLVAGVGIGALAVGFAAQTVVSNLISGLFLIFEGVFTLGDFVRVGDVMGKVVSTGFRTTRLQTVGGNIVIIPNSTLASSQIVNLTSGKNEMLLTVEEVIDIYADHEKAKKLMVEAVEETKGVIIDDAHHLVIVVDRDAGQWRTILKLFVTVEASNWHIIQSDIKENIKKKFDSHGLIPPVSALARDRLEGIKREAASLGSEG